MCQALAWVLFTLSSTQSSLMITPLVQSKTLTQKSSVRAPGCLVALISTIQDLGHDLSLQFVPPNGMHTPKETVVCELRQPGPFLREACPLLTCFVFRSLMLGDKVGMKKQIKMSFLSYRVKSAYN